MDADRAKAINALNSLSMSDFITEFEIRLSGQDHGAREVNERAMDLEVAVYHLLRHKKPTAEDYRLVHQKLSKVQQELRIPGLHDLSCERAAPINSKE